MLIFSTFQIIYDTGLRLRWILIGYVIIAILCITFSTFALLPKVSINVEQEQLSSTIRKKSAVELGMTNQAITPDGTEAQKTPETSRTAARTEGESSIEKLGVINTAISTENVQIQENTVESVGQDTVFTDTHQQDTS